MNLNTLLEKYQICHPLSRINRVGSTSQNKELALLAHDLTRSTHPPSGLRDEGGCVELYSGNSITNLPPYDLN